jgi:hypothetical protein
MDQPSLKPRKGETKMNLINQPTLRPTRKMAAVGWTSLLGPIMAAIIAPWLPGLSEACGGEVAASLVAGGLALAQGAVNFVAGYLVHEAR